MLMMTMLAAALLAGPAGATTPSHAAAAVDSTDMTLVTVQNDESNPIRVYVEAAVGEFHLGTVQADSLATLRIPALVAQDGAAVKFFVHGMGAEEQDSGYLEIERGDRIGLIVPKR
ncbi:MAG: hypothetical protein MNPFHGCM_00514 [Gemmatimonadaceae bacterium]|nr:hypothetical protein [Gemmatimonadaceae bacterium]